MCKPSNQYFEKIENGTNYRIYLIDSGMEPLLDAPYGVHDDLVELINCANAKVYNCIIRRYAHVIGFKQANEIACHAVRSYINIVMKRDGWTAFIE